MLWQLNGLIPKTQICAVVQELDSYIKLLHQLHLLCGLEPSCSCGMKSRVKSAMAMGISLPALPVIKAVVRCKAGRFIKMPREDQITSSMSPPQDRAGIVTPWRQQQGLLSLMLHGYESTNMNSYEVKMALLGPLQSISVSLSLGQVEVASKQPCCSAMMPRPSMIGVFGDPERDKAGDTLQCGWAFLLTSHIISSRSSPYEPKKWMV